MERETDLCFKKTAEMENSTRDLVVGSDRFTVAIGLCTHLGCIPAWKKMLGNVHVMVGNLILVQNKFWTTSKTT